MGFIIQGFGVAKGILNVNNPMLVCVLGSYHSKAHITSIGVSYTDPSGAALASFSVGSVTVLRERIDKKYNTYSPHPNYVDQWMRNGAGLTDSPDLNFPLWEQRFGAAFDGDGTSQNTDRFWYLGERGLELPEEQTYSVILSIPKADSLEPPAMPDTLAVLSVNGWIEERGSPFDKKLRPVG